MTNPTSLDPTASSGEAVAAPGNLSRDAPPSVLWNPNFRRLHTASVTSAGGASVAVVPDRVLGRVLSFDQVGGFAGIPAGLVLGGVLATEYGIGVDYLVAGLGLLVNGLAMLALKDLRGLRYQPGPAA